METVLNYNTFDTYVVHTIGDLPFNLLTNSSSTCNIFVLDILNLATHSSS